MASSAISDGTATADPSILQFCKLLTSESTPLSKRFRALFSLKHLASLSPPTPQTVPAIHAIASALSSPSALLKHELAYCLGQTRNHAAIPYLRAVLDDANEDPMCRHEAAEALGALGDEGSLDLLRRLRDQKDLPEVITETCDIAVARIDWEHSKLVNEMASLKLSDFASIDPAPPLPTKAAHSEASIEQLQKTLLDRSKKMFERYRAMFTLRDLASPPDAPTALTAIQALAGGFADPSALFRHEIAFVFGQLSHPASIPALVTTLRDRSEVGMVRHEAAEALGSLGDEEGVEAILREFVDDEEQVVRESCVVALDMAEYERSGEAEYAIVPEPLGA